jgi:hypothetical protein
MTTYLTLTQADLPTDLPTVADRHKHNLDINGYPYPAFLLCKDTNDQGSIYHDLITPRVLIKHLFAQQHKFERFAGTYVPNVWNRISSSIEEIKADLKPLGNARSRIIAAIDAEVFAPRDSFEGAKEELFKAQGRLLSHRVFLARALWDYIILRRAEFKFGYLGWTGDEVRQHTIQPVWSPVGAHDWRTKRGAEVYELADLCWLTAGLLIELLDNSIPTRNVPGDQVFSNTDAIVAGQDNWPEPRFGFGWGLGYDGKDAEQFLC